MLKTSIQVSQMIAPTVLYIPIGAEKWIFNEYTTSDSALPQSMSSN